ncbi:hypothetical protein K488DRAFT_57737 [Vararia minispora EC-137]|uniref:Uncharacterized protein n=1 Tax=Vararia minispora EC-137 TaxID=1314806 RepID=A0ACB8QBZ1_9AGAM|nr:hypothetical protein K488DRAFT_57737 [Vararia minispora EC-137]
MSDGAQEEKTCPGCHLSVMNENGGVVIAFGQSFFHVECFKCAKCHDTVTADTNLLLLSDGQPVCSNCSYSCSVCQLPILDEAIMTGDDSYHAHCFKCKHCGNRIDELMFAKTSNGIYCMGCHHQRVARSRRHAQKKEREKEERERAYPAGAKSRENGVCYASPSAASNGHHLSPPSSAKELARQVSYDDGIRGLFKKSAANGDVTPSGSGNSLSLPSAKGRSSKRHSINPGIQFDLASAGAEFGERPSSAGAESSSRPHSPHDTSNGRVTPVSERSQSQTRSRSESTPKPTTDQSQLSARLALPPSVTLERVPQRKDSAEMSSQPSTQSASRTLGIPSTVRPRRSFDDRPSMRTGGLSIDVEKSRGARDGGKSPAYKATSPSHRVDVPHGVESGTDTDNENDVDGKQNRDPPDPPPKSPHANRNLEVERPETPDTAGEASSDELLDQVRHSTFIAPALPPIRISLGAGDFSDLLRSYNDQRASLPALAESGEGVSPDTATSSTSGTSWTGDRTPSTSETSGSTLATPSDPTFFGKDDAASVSTVSPATVAAKAEGEIFPARHSFDDFSEPAHSSDLITRRLREALSEAGRRGAAHVNLDSEFAQAILHALEQKQAESAEMRGRLDTMKRASQQVMDGLSVAQGEYEEELRARRFAETEVTRLRVLLSDQAARITALSGEARRGELHQQLSRELSENLSVLERNLSRLRVERDMTLAEVEELESSKRCVPQPNEQSGASLNRSFTMRLDSLKAQYQHELTPLTEERSALLREIAELKASRDVMIEETTMLNARNEELATLNQIYTRRSEQNGTATSSPALQSDDSHGYIKVQHPSPPLQQQQQVQPQQPPQQPQAPVPEQGTLRKRGWLGGGGRVREQHPAAAAIAQDSDNQSRLQKLKHSFQQVSVLRVTRCEQCGDKLWGSQVRCTYCNLSVHHRCQSTVTTPCNPQATAVRKESPMVPLPPSMFGRDLIEQIRADSRGSDRMVPILVEKCIDAVEQSAMDYEGIYRKTGGSGQNKMITALFERQDYDAFDLTDQDRFNDICSITSVLKTYFRSLPNPLLTYVLHDEFMNTAMIKDPIHKSTKYADLVKQLPTEHYYTLRMLMLHLHRIHELSAQNLMTARNLGVVFGPTLMRSRNPGAEFSDMAGKALTVEWLIEHATDIFPPILSA